MPVPVFGLTLVAGFAAGFAGIRFCTLCCPVNPGVEYERGTMGVCDHGRLWRKRRFCWTRVSVRLYMRRERRALNAELDEQQEVT